MKGVTLAAILALSLEAIWGFMHFCFNITGVEIYDTLHKISPLAVRAYLACSSLIYLVTTLSLLLFFITLFNKQKS